MINIAEILKDCPKGTKLYSPLCGECTLHSVIDNYIKVEDKEEYIRGFLSNGKITLCGECQLFPSKDQRDWNKFHRPFKDGDVIYVKSKRECPELIGIYKSENSIMINDYCSASIDGKSFYLESIYGLIYKSNIDAIRIATEEEKQKLFQAIKDNGYRWNPETKTLEKLIEHKFKVGDKIKYKYGKNNDGVEYGKILSITDNTYDVAVTDNMGIFIPVEQQNDWELVSDKVEPLFKVGDEIVKKNGITNSFIVQSVNDEYYGLQLPDKSGVGVLPTKEQDDWMVISSKPKFKVGDKIKHKSQRCDICTVKDIQNNQYIFEEIWSTLPFDEQHHYELVSIKVEPKFKVGDIIQDIVGICKVKITEVNVKDEYYLYKSLNINGIGGISFNRQDNWELVPTKFDDCDEFYKNWK